MPVIIRNPIDIVIELKGVDVIDSETMFKLADVIDAYEVEQQTEKTIVVDICEINANGLIVMHVDPKMMIRYNEIHQHIEAIIASALKIFAPQDVGFEVTKIIFRTLRPGIPSRVIREADELDEKMERTWDTEIKDSFKSYA